MEYEDPRILLARIGVLRHPCDLDLLVFFARHPRVLLTSESLARFLGYSPKEIARSLDTLLATGLLARTQTDAHAGRLYVLSRGRTGDEWFPVVLALASSREGRRSLMTALHERAVERERENDA